MLPIPHPAVLFQPVSEGAILLHTEQEIYFGLNSVGVEIWEMLPPTCFRLEEVCDALARRYPEVRVEDLRSDITELLETLEAEGLVVAPGAA